jgi:regulator of protease activity HflC (stomatin/prohibitin superfamily)
MPILEKMILTYWLYIIGGIIVLVFLAGIRIIRPNSRGVVEFLGKYTGIRQPGFNWIVPLFQRMIRINTTEQMTHIEPQEIITKDNLNAQVDLVVYFKINKDEKSLTNVLYEVKDVYSQLDTLARTTARNVIGTMVFKDVNSERKILNDKLQTILITETKNWGVQVLKVELKEIVPPKDVQETMNSVIKAQNTKDAALDLATANETQADGKRRAAIKEAEGLKQAQVLNAEGDKAARILVAEGQAKAFDLINKSFTKNAITLKQLEITQASLEKNSKIIVTDKGISPQLIIGKLETN